MSSQTKPRRPSGSSGTVESATNRRRSQRLFLQVPIVIEADRPGKPRLTENTHTIVVNAHGALIQMRTSLDHGQIVTLRNIRTSEECECVVKLATPSGPGKFNTALEFTKPSPAFWHVSFPPEDWSVRHPDAKKIS